MYVSTDGDRTVVERELLGRYLGASIADGSESSALAAGAPIAA
jgi:hypothetical protein